MSECNRGIWTPSHFLEEEGLLLVTTISPSCSLSNKAFSSKYDIMLISVYSILLLFTKWFYILLYSIVQLYIVPLSFQFIVQQFNTYLDNCLSMSCYTVSLKKNSRKQAQWCNVQALSMLLSKISKHPVWKHGNFFGGEKKKFNLCSSWIFLNILCTVPSSKYSWESSVKYGWYVYISAVGLSEQ